jgi:hypothetical protein
MEFKTALKAHQFSKNPRSQSGELYGSIISALDNEKEAVETAAALPNFWNSVPEFENYISLQALESRVSRALLMLSCTKAFQWVAWMATASVKSRINANCWIYQLAKDVETEWNFRNNNPDHPKEAIFNSLDYLPSLGSPCEATVVLKRWGMIEDEEKEIKMIQTVSCIVETWLQFPTSKDNRKNDQVRCSLISIILKKMPHSILFLDPVWSMFLRPYQLLIHGRPRQRIAHPHTEKTLNLFEECIQRHMMKNSASKEYLLLEALTEQSERWFRLINSKERIKPQQIAPVYYDVRLILHNN